MRSQNQPSSDAVPLCVDLDGTLLNTDTLYESVFVLLKKNAFYVLMLPLWLFKGKAYLKQEITNRIGLDVSLLPLNEQLIGFLREEHDKGRHLVLVTAANLKLALRISEHVGLFDEVIASNNTTNLAGRNKQQELVNRFGERGFDYAGNSRADLTVWEHARYAILVNTSRNLEKHARHVAHVQQLFRHENEDWINYIKMIRAHQWLKNLLIFVPLLLSHQAFNLGVLTQSFIAFLAFSLCASSVYILNDLLDLDSDRLHPTKCKRPFAAGSIPIFHGIAVIPLLFGASILLSLTLPLSFQIVLITYYAITLSYSLRLKRAALVDVIILAGLYTLRVIAGASAISVQVSFWLLAFSMFAFFSLALVKRYSEFYSLLEKEKSTSVGRGYTTADLPMLSQFGTASAYLAVLVLALYVNSDEVKSLYTYPQVIWLLCPLVLYLMSRVWLLAGRGKLHEDPIVFAIQDHYSQAVGLIGAILLWIAI